jgi:hypothetical protein
MIPLTGLWMSASTRPFDRNLERARGLESWGGKRIRRWPTIPGDNWPDAVPFSLFCES